MSPAGVPCAAVVLAAGRGTRFGGQKLLAALDGRPLLQHVLDTARSAGLEPVVVVVGGDAAALRRDIDWHAERIVVNPQPERGLSSSLSLGLDALAAPAAPPATAPPPARAMVLLGDQPRVDVRTLLALRGLPVDEDRPIVVPIYGDGQPGNPVLLERAGWPLGATLRGDRGMRQLFAVRPALVRHVRLAGSNPDVDTPADLERITCA